MENVSNYCIMPHTAFSTMACAKNCYKMPLQLFHQTQENYFALDMAHILLEGDCSVRPL